MRSASRSTSRSWRGGHRIAHLATFAVPTPEGGGLEINHGVEDTAPSEGDCWDGATPDIRPYDRIVVTDVRGHKDAILVDDLGVSSGPLPCPTASPSLGWARSALPGRRSSSTDGGRVAPGDFRPAQSPSARTPPRAAASGPLPERGARRLGRCGHDAPAGMEHMIGYGHAPIVLPNGTEELQPETQIFDVGGVTGPAVGCEGLAPAAGADAATALDARMLTTTTDGLRVSGTAAPDVTSVSVAVSDGAGGVATAATDSRAERPERPRGLAARVDGERAAGRHRRARRAGGPVGHADVHDRGRHDAARDGPEPDGRPRRQAPDAPTATPGPGELDAGKTVRLRAEAGARIHFTLDGTEPDLTSERYSLPIAIASATTIRAIAVDAAGNVSPTASLRFTLRAAPSAAPTSPAAPAAAPVLVPGLGSAHASALRVAGVSVRSARLTLRQARREGLVARFAAPAGASYAEARLVRIGAGGARRVVATKLMAAAGGRQLARFTGAGVRRKLSRGRYALEVRAGEAPTRLGAPATTLVRIG